MKKCPGGSFTVQLLKTLPLKEVSMVDLPIFLARPSPDSLAPTESDLEIASDCVLSGPNLKHIGDQESRQTAGFLFALRGLRLTEHVLYD